MYEMTNISDKAINENRLWPNKNAQRYALAASIQRLARIPLLQVVTSLTRDSAPSTIFGALQETTIQSRSTSNQRKSRSCKIPE